MTIAFVDVLGFTPLAAELGTERAYLAMTRCVRELDEIARHHGGSVDKYLGDRLMVVFGHPVPLDRPERNAARSALEMRSRVREFNDREQLAVPFGIRIGLNTGEVVAGDIRGPVVREFHVLGDVVNTAARLAAKAGDAKIFVGKETFEATRQAFSYETLRPFALKGKASPVPAYALRGARGASEGTGLVAGATTTGELFGRDPSLAALRHAVDVWRNGGGAGTVRVEGPEGAGKSRLLAELRPQLAESNTAVLSVYGDPLSGERALASFAGGLDGWLGAHEAEPAQRRELLTRRIAPEHRDRDLIPLTRLLELPMAPAEARRHDARPRASRLAAATDAILALLEAQARAGPLALMIEDVQHLDDASLELLVQLVAWAEARHVLLILTHRSVPEGLVPLEAALASLDPDRCLSLGLEPIDEQAARALVTSLIPDEDPDIVTAVVERGAGNPGRLGMAAFLAPALRSEREQAALRSRERTHETERRRAVVLFADISGFTAMTERVGGERAYPIVADALGLLDGVARAHGGTVDHYLGDCVMAMFGVPDAIEDAPRSAVNAAIEMRQRIDRFAEERGTDPPLSVHTGIAAGLGIAGDVSGPMIREFAVMGDHVHLADELCHEASSGEIFVDAEVERLTREVFDFAEAGRVNLEGRAESFTAHEVRSDAVHLHRARIGIERRVFSTLVGRDAEFDRLRKRLATLAAGEGGVISLVAEAGLGKSRLLAELAASPEAEAVSWQCGRCLSNGLSVPFHPIRDLMRSWIGIDDTDDPQQARDKLERGVGFLLPDKSDDDVPILANLMGLPVNARERAHLSQIQGDALEFLVRGAMTQVLRAASAQQPLVIVLEDLHWADHSSVELVTGLLRLAAEHRILFLHAFRPSFPGTSGRLQEHAQEAFGDRHLEVTLSPLPPNAARQLVKNLFGGGDVPQITRAAIEERAQGNPFYIEEVVRTLVDAGAVERRGDAFFATEKLDSVAIPETVQEAVMARVDRLEPALRALLQAASVVGGSFHRDVLAALAEDAAQLDDRLTQLVAGEFVMPIDRMAGLEYSFKHPLIQEVTYDALLETRRRELHREVGGAIEANLDASLPGYSAMLAFHYSMGGDVERAEDFLFQAGDEAARIAASSEALNFFKAASNLYIQLHGEGGDTEKRAMLERNIGTALLNRGQLLDAVDHFDRATELMGAPVPRQPLPMWGRFAWNLVRVLTPMYLPAISRKRLPAADAQEQKLFELMFTRAMAQSTAAPTRFLVDCMAMLARGRGLAPETIPEAAAMYSGIVAIFALGGLSFEMSRRFLGIAEDLAERGALQERVLYFRTLRFLHHLLEGNWSAEYEIEPEAIEEGLRDGRFWEAQLYLNLDGVKRVYQGDFDTARERIESLAKIADLYQHDLAASAQHAVSAYLHVERRELPEALDALELYYDEHREPLFNLLALGTRAKVHALQGDFDQAEAYLDRADIVLAEAGRVPPYHASSVRVARYGTDLGRLNQARQQGLRSGIRAARRRLRRSGPAALVAGSKVAFRRPEVLRLRGLEAWWTGRRRKALECWRETLEECEHLGAHPELARTWLAAGRALREAPELGPFEGQDAEGCLRAAREIFEALDLRFDLEQLEREA